MLYRMFLKKGFKQGSLDSVEIAEFFAIIGSIIVWQIQRQYTNQEVLQLQKHLDSVRIK